MRDSNPQPTAPEAVALPLSQRCRSRFDAASAYATAKPRAPDGTRARTAVADRGPTAYRRLFPDGDSLRCTAAAGASRCTRVWWTSFANAETKMPPAWNPRAFAVPRKIGVTDLPWKGPVSSGQRLHTRTTRAGPHRAWAAMASGRWL